MTFVAKFYFGPLHDVKVALPHRYPIYKVPAGFVPGLFKFYGSISASPPDTTIAMHSYELVGDNYFYAGEEEMDSE